MSSGEAKRTLDYTVGSGEFLLRLLEANAAGILVCIILLVAVLKR